MHISSTHIHATTQIPIVTQRLRATVWTSDILSLITCSQHNTAQQTNTQSNFRLCFFVVFFYSLPLLPPHCHFLSFSVWDWGWGLRRGGGPRSKQGRREKDRLAPANNPLFQHVQLHISKLKWSARKGAYKTLNVLWLRRCSHVNTPPSCAPGAYRILLDLQCCSKLKPYITQLIRPWERGPAQSFWG